MFRIHDRTSSSSPLIVRLTIIARRNELLTGTRHHRSFLLIFFLRGRLPGSLLKRMIDPERRTYNSTFGSSAWHKKHLDAA